MSLHKHVDGPTPHQFQQQVYKRAFLQVAANKGLNMLFSATLTPLDSGVENVDASMAQEQEQGLGQFNIFSVDHCPCVSELLPLVTIT